MIGSTTEGPEEIEHAPALSLTLGSLPGTSLSLSHIGQQLPDGGEQLQPQIPSTLCALQLPCHCVLAADTCASNTPNSPAALMCALPRQ